MFNVELSTERETRKRWERLRQTGVTFTFDTMKPWHMPRRTFPFSLWSQNDRQAREHCHHPPVQSSFADTARTAMETLNWIRWLPFRSD